MNRPHRRRAGSRSGFAGTRRVGCRSIAALSCWLLLCGPTVAQAEAGDADLLKDYHGKLGLPASLHRVYTSLVSAMRAADLPKVQTHCLPQSVTFTTEPRPDKTREYGQDMNVPFLKQGFHAYVLNIRQDSSDTFLIRTGSSYLFFVHASATGWKLYRYGDKPIE